MDEEQTNPKRQLRVKSSRSNAGGEKKVSQEEKARENGVGGSKLWVVLALILSVLFCLYFTYASGVGITWKPKQGVSAPQSPKVDSKLNIFGEKVYHF